MKNSVVFSSLVLFSGFLLCGCGVNDVQGVGAREYTTVSDYANAVIEKSGCIGKIDGLFISAGERRVTKNGLEYVFLGNNLHCTRASFKEKMADYCRSKGGESVQNETWCKIGDSPIFHIDGLSTLEKSQSQSQEQWFNAAIKRGFISERVKNEEALLAKRKRELSEKEKNRIMNTIINADVGDLICREDYDVNPYQYQTKIYYQGYVEDKKGNKMKVRVIKHGGNGVIINDSSINEIIWSENKGWFHCG